jgi:hypothetical protein
LNSKYDTTERKKNMSTEKDYGKGAAGAPVLKSYADVQALLDTFVKNAGVDTADAPHGVFWRNLTYQQFITGNVPGVPSPAFKILVVGNSQQSAIIQILKGIGAPSDNFGQMPQPSPPYPGQDAVITALAQWIDAKCPNG